MKSLKVVAFDLDDTLLRLSPDFIPQYLQRLDDSLQEVFSLSEPLSRHIMTSSARMMQKTRDPERLEDFFYRDFEARTGLSRELLEDRFNAFYREEFPKLAPLAKPVYGVVGMLASLKARGYRVALLTSALFPRVAIDERLKWAGLEDFPFDWRSALEVVHATKPQPGYYLEAAEQLHIAPEHWLMVGNDLVEDIIPAHQAGMSVFWVHGDVTDEEAQKVPQGTPVGSIDEVLPYILEDDDKYER